jgi:photosystem II stability/assembly factor-like uncharacterized protein
MKAAGCLAVIASCLWQLSVFGQMAPPPGLFWSIGPGGILGQGALDLVYPAGDDSYLLLRTREDLLVARSFGRGWVSVAKPAGIRPAGLLTDSGDPKRWYLSEEDEVDARIWQTADAGKTWVRLNLPEPAKLPEDFRELRLFLDHFDPAKLAIEIWSSRLQIYSRFVSLDRGATWSELPVGLDPAQPQMLGINDGYVYFRSQRLLLGSGHSVPLHLEDARRLVFDLERQDLLYAELFSGAEFTWHRSVDRGGTLQAMLTSKSPSNFFIQSPAYPDQLALDGDGGLMISADRGATFTLQPDSRTVSNAAYDPNGGHLMVADGGFARWRPDGSRRPAYNNEREAWMLAAAAQGRRLVAVSWLSHAWFLEPSAAWQDRGPIGIDDRSGQKGCGGAVEVLLAEDDPRRVVAVCQNAAFTSEDAGRTWKNAPGYRGLYPTPFQLSAAGQTLYLLNAGRIFHSADFGRSWEQLPGGGFGGIAAHKELGLLAVGSDGSLSRYLPGVGWQMQEAVLPGNEAASRYPPYITGAADSHPGLVYGIFGSRLSRSLDFGASWEKVADLGDGWQETDYRLQLVIDPFDRDHFVLAGLAFETRDGGRTFTWLPDAVKGTVAFDALSPDRTLISGFALRGLRERRDVAPASP